MDTQVWLEFFKENWLVIAVALIVLLIVINLVKTVVKWLLVALIIGGLIIYSGISLDKISDVVSTVTNETVDTVKTEVMEMMIKEAKEAKYTSNGDGTFTVKSPNLEVTGETGSEKVEITFHGIPAGKWDINETIEQFIEQSKQNTGN